MTMMLVLSLLFVAWTTVAVVGVEAADRWASRTGTGSTCSEASPCSVQTMIGQLVSGDVGILKNDASPYQGDASMLTITGKTGTVSQRITIRAETDGGVRLDGQFARSPIGVSNSAYITVTGFNTHSSLLNAVVRVSGASNSVEIKRVVAWDAAMNQNSNVCSVTATGTVLFEDVACFGAGRKGLDHYGTAGQFTCRRCWARWEGSVNVGPKMPYTFVYNSSNFLCENCIAMWSGESLPQEYITYNNGTRWPAASYGGGVCISGATTIQIDGTNYCKFTNFGVEQPYGLFAVDRIDAADKCANIRLYGSLAMYLPSARYAPYMSGGAYFVNLNCIDIQHTYVYMGQTRPGFSLNQLESGAASLNASRVTSVRPSSDLFTAAWAGSATRSIATTVSGAANAFSSSTTGANLCFRYENGAVTTTPLWPWPMNDRIKAATALAGAYGGPCPDCVGGRLTRTEFDLTATVEAILGTIPPECRNDAPSSVLYVGHGTWVGHTTVTTLTPGLVTGASSSAQYLAVVAARSTSAPTWTFPSEWERVTTCHQSNIALEVWKKLGAAPASSPSITISAVGSGHSAVLVAWHNTPGVVAGSQSSSTAVATWVPGSVTTLENDTRIISVVASPDLNQIVIQSLASFTARMIGASWDTTIGPHAIGMADATQVVAGAVAMPTWQQELNGPDPWCGATVALGLIAIPPPPPIPQGGTPPPVPRFVIGTQPIVTPLTATPIPVTPVPLP